MKLLRRDKQISIGERKFACRYVCAACPCPPGCFIVRLHIAAAAARRRALVHVSKRRVMLEGLGEAEPPPLAMFLHLPTAPEAPGGCSPPFLFSTPLHAPL